jgi:Sulphur transport
MAMTLPLYTHDAFGYFFGLLAGTLIGVAFGFTLERAGFGRARNLAAQFYLTDTRVLKVMFTAIVTALLGMTLLSGIGVLDLAQITVPETFLWPQLVGGLVLGAGFIISGYCPGTGVVAVSSGNLDGVVALVGVMLGSLVFGFGYSPLEGFYKSGSMGVVRLDQLIGVPMAVMAAAVVAMAVGAFLLGEKLEGIFTKRAGEPMPDSPRILKIRVFSGFAVVAALALVALALPTRSTSSVERPVGKIAALDLARQLVTAPDDFWILDLRSSAAAESRIPGSLALPPGDSKAAFAAALAPSRKLVMYADGDIATLPEGVQRYRGPEFVLTGGFKAWNAAVLTTPALPDNATPVELAELQLRAALHAHYTGGAVAPPAKIDVKPNAPSRSEPKKGGGC